MAKNPTPSKAAPAADQQQEAKSDQATNTSSEAMASAPAAGGQPSPAAESGSGAENAGSSLGSNEQGPALNTQTNAPVEAASPIAGATTDDNSASAGDLESLQEQPAKQAYAVTGRTDVLHDGKLYTEGELVWLDRDSARPLLNNRCITATGGTQ